jgi:hypothetical protein
MASARYWRCVFLTAPRAGTFGSLSLARLEFRDAVGGTNLATGGTASASANNPGETPANAFDGNNATVWSAPKAAYSLNANTWLKYDFGSAVEVAEVAIRSRADTAPQQTPCVVLVQSSTDDSTWTDRALWVADSAWSLAQWRTFAVPSAFPGVYRGWRCASTWPGTGRNCGEMIFRDRSAARVVLGFDGVVFADSYWSFSTDFPERAFDGTPDTWWSEQNILAGVPVRLGGFTSDPDAIVADLQWQHMNTSINYDRAPTGIVVEASKNGLDWDEIGSFTPATWNTPSQIQTFDLPEVAVVGTPPTTGNSGSPLAPITAEVRRGGVRDTGFGGILRAVKVSGSPTLAGTLEVMAAAGVGVFNNLRPEGTGPIRIDIIAPDDPEIAPVPLPEIEVEEPLPPSEGGATTMTRSTGGAMSTFRR